MPGNSRIEVWRINAKPAASTLPGPRYQPGHLDQWRSLLDHAEQARADAFLSPDHRADYIVAHAALRTVLARNLGVPPASLSIDAKHGAKPALIAPAASALRFNLSHSGGAVLIALAYGREVGVDVEWQRPIHELDAIARTVMSITELEAWSRLPPAGQFTAFYHLWTRKEAYLKAIGLGLFREPRDISVPVSTEPLEQDPLPAPVTVQDQREAGAWRLCDVPVWESFSAAVCWQGSDAVDLVLSDLTLEEIGR